MTTEKTRLPTTNTRLITTAAPDLLEALDALESAVADHFRCSVPRGVLDAQCNAILALRRHALTLNETA
jgi:hypothetical protein